MNPDFEQACALIAKAKKLTAEADRKMRETELCVRGRAIGYEQNVRHTTVVCDALSAAKIAASAAQLASDAMQTAFDNWKVGAE